MIQVTCAVIQKDNHFLICQRSEQMKLPLKWEFPGGKVENNESLEACLIREIQEELNILIKIERKMEKIVHHYPSSSIILYPFLCTIKEGEINLNEHKQYQWILKNEFEKYDLAEADLPIIKAL